MGLMCTPSNPSHVSGTSAPRWCFPRLFGETSVRLTLPGTNGGRVDRGWSFVCFLRWGLDTFTVIIYVDNMIWYDMIYCISSFSLHLFLQWWCCSCFWKYDELRIWTGLSCDVSILCWGIRMYGDPLFSSFHFFQTERSKSTKVCDGPPQVRRWFSRKIEILPRP